MSRQLDRHRHGDTAPRDAAGPRPAPPATEGRRPVRVGRRSEQILGRERDRIAARLAQRYLAGATIRDLATETGRPFGWARTLLLEAGVELRARGGDHGGRRRGPETGRYQPRRRRGDGPAPGQPRPPSPAAAAATAEHAPLIVGRPPVEPGRASLIRAPARSSRQPVGPDAVLVADDRNAGVEKDVLPADP